jgi:hypothetical protein
MSRLFFLFFLAYFAFLMIQSPDSLDHMTHGAWFTCLLTYTYLLALVIDQLILLT